MKRTATFPFALLVLLADARAALADIAAPDPVPMSEGDSGLAILLVVAFVVMIALVALVVIRRMRK